MERSKTKEALLLVFCTMLLIGVILLARFLRGDFTKNTFVHTPIESNTQGYVVEKDGLFLININRADAEMLIMLDGIGETLARRILEYREENGAFESVEDLLHIKGIGEKTFEQIKPRIVCLPEDMPEKEIPDEDSSFFGMLEGLFD